MALFSLVLCEGKKVNQELQLRSGTVVYYHQEKLNISQRKTSNVCTLHNKCNKEWLDMRMKSAQ